MKNPFPLAAALLIFSAVHAMSGPIVTWLGTSADLSLETNWSGGVAPSSANTANFTSSAATKTNLTLNGEDFTAQVIQFISSNYTFEAPAGPGNIVIGDATTGGLNLSSATVDFDAQSIFLNNNMSWSVSGGSQLASSGTVDTTGGGSLDGIALTLAFGAGQTNNRATFGTFDFGTTGTLTVTNWGGTPGQFGGVNNQLRFSSDPTGDLPNIKFTVGASTLNSTAQNFGSYWEVVPVPEPATCFLLAGGMACLGILRHRRII